MAQYYKFLSVAATIMISNKCQIIAEQVVAIFMTSLVTTAIVNLLKTPSIFPLSTYNSKTSPLTPIVYY